MLLRRYSFGTTLKIFFAFEAIQVTIQMEQLGLEVVDIHYVVSSTFFETLVELIFEGRCFSRSGDGVLIKFHDEFELKLHIGLGELSLSFGGFFLVIQGLRKVFKSYGAIAEGFDEGQEKAKKLFFIDNIM